MPLSVLSSALALSYSPGPGPALLNSATSHSLAKTLVNFSLEERQKEFLAVDCGMMVATVLTPWFERIRGEPI